MSFLSYLSGGDGAASGGDSFASGGDGIASGGDSLWSGGDAARGHVSPLDSGALVTSRDGIVGRLADRHGRNAPTPQPSDLAQDKDDNLEAWAPWVRRQIWTFELLADISVDGRTVTDTASVSVGSTTLCQLVRPTTAQLEEFQVDHVHGYADLRRDRAAEVLAQRGDILSFFASVVGLRPERHRWTIELLAACLSATISVHMRIKHSLAVRRPVDLSAQVQPMIITPGHGSLPSGHATEAFMMAEVLSQLVHDRDGGIYPTSQTGGDNRPQLFRQQLFQLAARIATNRVIAGVHYPVDSAVGQVLGMLLGRYFHAKSGEAAASLFEWKLNGAAYMDADFRTRDIRQRIESDDLSIPSGDPASDPTSGYLTKEPGEIDVDAFTSTPATSGRAQLVWLLKKAKKEWK